VTFIKIRSHRRKFPNSDSVEQKKIHYIYKYASNKAETYTKITILKILKEFFFLISIKNCVNTGWFIIGVKNFDIVFRKSF
jgi:hypothetical protein